MVCSPANTYIGTTQTLSYGTGGNVLTVNLQRLNFKPETGQGLLPMLGYDRVDASDFQPEIKRSTMGVAYWNGPSFDPPQEFQWSLQSLTDAQFWAIDGMIKRQQREKEPVKLLDTRWAFQEPLPRTRARVGAVLLSAGGRVIYFAQFLVHLRFDGSPTYRVDGAHECRLKGTEMGRVPLTEDV